MYGHNIDDEEEEEEDADATHEDAFAGSTIAITSVTSVADTSMNNPFLDTSITADDGNAFDEIDVKQEVNLSGDLADVVQELNNAASQDPDRTPEVMSSPSKEDTAIQNPLADANQITLQDYITHYQD